jgi:hypothetical protein
MYLISKAFFLHKSLAPRKKGKEKPEIKAKKIK